MPNFTLCLSSETAERIRTLNRIFGGSVGGFATEIVNDIAALDAATVLEVRRQIIQLADEARKKEKPPLTHRKG